MQIFFSFSELVFQVLYNNIFLSISVTNNKKKNVVSDDFIDEIFPRRIKIRNATHRNFFICFKVEILSKCALSRNLLGAPEAGNLFLFSEKNYQNATLFEFINKITDIFYILLINFCLLKSAVNEINVKIHNYWEIVLHEKSLTF